MQPEDLTRLSLPSDPCVHPDGTRVAFVVTRLDADQDRYVRAVWVWEADGARRFTSGPGDLAPRWSPGGESLAFLRTAPDQGGKPQVAVMPVDGGEATVLSDFALGVDPAPSLDWSPDGRWLAVVGIAYLDEGLDDAERARRPRRVRFHPYRFDGKGRLDDRRRHLWLIDATGVEAPRDLTPGPYDVTAFAWSPDGTRLAVVSDRSPRRGLDPGTDVWEVDTGGGEPVRVAPRGMWLLPGYRPDGVLHLTGNADTDWPRLVGLWRRDPDGAWIPLTDHLDRSLVSVAAGPRLRWVGDQAFAGLEDAGRQRIVRIHPDGTVDRLVGGDRVVADFDVSSSGDRIVFTASRPDDPPALFESIGDAERRLTGFETEGLGLVEPEHFQVVSDGVEVDAWVYLPEGDGPVAPLVNIHGGPATQYGFGFFDEFQVYVGAGYGVVACNPRGSAGRGEDFLRAVVGDGWGTVDTADVGAVVDAALKRFPRLDRERLGVMGGSYGGFLTAWMIGHDRRFRSAVVERALISYPSFAGTSDIAATFPVAYTGTDYPEGWEVWWDKSPLSVAHRVETPTLIVHSEDDYRCPIEQAEQLFLALLRNGVDVELLRFPGEGHELSRSGAPRHRIERFQAILEWHDRHLR